MQSPRLKTDSPSQYASGPTTRLTDGVAHPDPRKLSHASPTRSLASGEKFSPSVHPVWDSSEAFAGQLVTELTPADRNLRRRLAAEFHAAATCRGYCAVCHVRAPYLHAHHCVEAGFLKRELRALVDDLRLTAILFDPRNALGVCDRCHMNDHWSATRRIFQRHIPESAWEFARELDLLTSTEKFTVRLESYPEIAEAA